MFAFAGYCKIISSKNPCQFVNAELLAWKSALFLLVFTMVFVFMLLLPSELVILIINMLVLNLAGIRIYTTDMVQKYTV